MILHSKVLRRLRRCESGAVFSVEVILLSVVMMIGLMVAFSSVRDSVVAELTDSTLAVQHSQQSFVVNGVGAASSTTAGSDFVDEVDPFDGEDVANAVVGFDFEVIPFDESSLDTLIQPKNYRFVMRRNGFTWNGTGDFDDGRYSGAPYWPGSYTTFGNTATVIFDPLGGGWNDGRMVLDGTDPDNLTGSITWINSITGFVWEASYQLIAQ